MKERIKKMKLFIKNHKKEITIGAGAIVGGVVVCKFVSNRTRSIEAVGISNMELHNAISEEEIAKWGCTIGTVDDIWMEDGLTNMIVNDLKPGDLGDFGNELLKRNEVNGETLISAILCVTKAEM